MSFINNKNSNKDKNLKEKERELEFEENNPIKMEQFDSIENYSNNDKNNNSNFNTNSLSTYDTFNESEPLRKKNMNNSSSSFENIPISLNLAESDLEITNKHNDNKSPKESLQKKIDRLTLLFYFLIIFEIITHYVIGRNILENFTKTMKEMGIITNSTILSISSSENNLNNNIGNTTTPVDFIHSFFLVPFVVIFFSATKYINIYTQTLLDLYLCIIISVDLWFTGFKYKFIIFFIENLINYCLILYLISKNREYNSKYL